MLVPALSRPRGLKVGEPCIVGHVDAQRRARDEPVMDCGYIGPSRGGTYRVIELEPPIGEVTRVASEVSGEAVSWVGPDAGHLGASDAVSGR